MSKYQTLERLAEIQQELDSLGEEAAQLFRENFPSLYQTGDAYGAFTFGSSWNSFDTTFARLVEWAENAEDEYEEEEMA